MKKVLTRQLTPGLKVSLAVFNAEGVVLLQEGQELTPKYIDRLKQAAIPFVYVDDEDLPSGVIMDIISSQSRAEAVKTLRDWIFKPEENQLLKDDGSAKLTSLINNLVTELRDNPDRCVKFLDIRAVDDFTFAHSVNVCVLSLVTGMSMGMTDEELLVLGLAALLHDNGKVRVPEEVLRRDGLFTTEDFTDMVKHPYYGYEFLLGDPLINPLVAEIVYQHHERYNGSGYPRCLKGDEIHRCAYIIGVADVYDALTHDRSYRQKYLPHEAIEYLYGAGNYLFDYKVVDNFIRHIAQYPIGTIVELNNGEQGTVVDIVPKLSGRPIVRVHRDNKGSLLVYPKTYDLTKEPTLLVAKVLE